MNAARMPIHVLYVDDNHLDRELVRDVLEKADGDFQVKEAAGREDFLESLSAGGWDIVLTDFHIGGFEGLEVIEEVKKSQPGVPVVMLTGTGSEEVAVEALKRGAADYVLKKTQHIQKLPFTLRSALERVQAQELERRITRELRALTECNQALLRATDEQSLYDDICRIVCESAGYRLAWVGLLGDGGVEDLRVVACAGNCGWSPVPGCVLPSEQSDPSSAIVRRAIRCGCVVCDQDIPMGAESGAAGVGTPVADRCSGAALPLKGHDGAVFGVMVICAGKPDAITPDDLRLLEELAADLAYGVTALRSRTKTSRAEDALKQSEERLRLALEASGQGMWDVDAVTGEVFASPELARIQGFEPDAHGVSHEIWKSRIHEDDLKEAEGLMRACLSGEAPLYETEYRIRGDRGEWKWLLSRGRVVERAPDGRPLHIMGTTTDVTDRKQAEEALRQVEEQLRQSQKMEAIGRLAGGIAHDFNNILTIILGYSEMILTGGAEGDPDTLHSEIEAIRAAAERARVLTRQILAFSRRQALASEVVCLNDVVRRVEGLVRRTLGEQIEFVTLPDETLGLTEIDAGQLEQVLVNMVLNSRDAMPKGGELTVETANVELDGSYCQTHPDALPGQHVMVAVSDTGIGMDEQTKARVFEPFFTTKDPDKGTGLGLATAYGLIRQSGGSISVDSEPGVGTTFRIYLPRIDVATKQQVIAGGRSVASGGCETVLVVEDEPAVQDLVKRILEGAGFSVLTTGTGEEALPILRGDQPLSLLLTDMILAGGMRGDAVADEALRLRPDLPVRYMSGYVSEWAAEGGRLNVGVNCLVKPFHSEDLVRFVRDALPSTKAPGS